jgi:hypothetical protein
MANPLASVSLVLPGSGPPDPDRLSARLDPLLDRFEVSGREQTRCRFLLGWRTPEGEEFLAAPVPRDGEPERCELAASPLTADEREAVVRAPWEISCAMALDPADPLASWARLLRYALFAVPDALAVVDDDTGFWRRVERVAAIAGWKTPPPVDDILGVHGVSGSSGYPGTWFHTHGLQRAGLPDLELLAVPPEFRKAAHSLLTDFARAILGTKVAPSGVSSSIFPGHRIAWVPVRVAAARLPPADAGALENRMGGHLDRRIALVAPGGTAGRPFRLPIALLRSYVDRDPPVVLPALETERAASLARERWDHFTRLFDRRGSEPGWRFRALLAAGAADSHPPHWTWVQEVRGDLLRVRHDLPDCPACAAESRPTDWFGLAEVADWRIDTPTSTLHPGVPTLPE